MAGALAQWELRDSGIHFSLFAGTDFLPFGAWTGTPVRLKSGTEVDIGAALPFFLECGAKAEDDGATLPHHVVAALPQSVAIALGLPATSTFSWRVRASGDLSSPDFRFVTTPFHLSGRQVARWARQGALLTVGSSQYRLSSDEYAFLEELDAFARIPAKNFDDRFRAWARVREIVPAAFTGDSFIAGFAVTRATAFGLRPAENQRGEPDFELIVAEPGADDSQEPRDALSPGPSERFAAELRKRSRVPSRVLVGDGHVVVIDEPVRAALEVARGVQSSSAGRRAAFISNPRAFLREALERAYGEDVLEQLFVEFPTGERVRGVAEWQPNPLPMQPSGISWLPPGPADPPSQGQSTANLQPSPGDRPPPVVVHVADNTETVEFLPGERVREGQLRVPQGIQAELLDHQRDGLAWCQERWIRGTPGALLADDMGLGKTLTTLAFLAWVREMPGDGRGRQPSLVVAPTGLLMNWKAEAAKHLEPGTLGSVLDAFGQGLQSLRMTRGLDASELAAGLPVLDFRRLAAADWVLATYETVRDYQHSFCRVKWAVVVLDEAQKVKNPAAGVTNAAKALNADFTIALTGTPVENRLADLWTIVDKVAPGSLGSLRDFRDRYERPLLGHSDVSAYRAAAERAGTELKAALTGSVDRHPPVMKRRLKVDHLRGLPPKETYVVECEMSAHQARAYDDIVEASKRSSRGRNTVLAAIQNLRTVSLHAPLDPVLPDAEVLGRSARVTATVQILDRIRDAGEKALIFTDSLELQGRLATLLQRRYALRCAPMIINGEVLGPRRQAIVDEFQSGPAGLDVMILSPKAGGVGLTLTAANHVIHLSRWWNPAVEDQATDRVYRIGQTKPVHVHIPLAIHPRHKARSFDWQLNQLMLRKRTLCDSVLAPPQPTDEELSGLLDSVVSNAHPTERA